jgi:hypothetical protein
MMTDDNRMVSSIIIPTNGPAREEIGGMWRGRNVTMTISNRQATVGGKITQAISTTAVSEGRRVIPGMTGRSKKEASHQERRRPRDLWTEQNDFGIKLNTVVASESLRQGNSQRRVRVKKNLKRKHGTVLRRELFLTPL